MPVPSSSASSPRLFICARNRSNRLGYSSTGMRASSAIYSLRESQLEGELRQIFHAAGGHHIISFETDAAPERLGITARLDSHHIAGFENMIAAGNQPRRLLRIEADAVPRMVIERAAHEVERIHVAANLFPHPSGGNTRPDHSLGDVERVPRNLPGFHLPVGRRRHGERATKVGVIPAKTRVDVDDIQIVRLDLARKRRSTAVDSAHTTGEVAIEFEIVTRGTHDLA